MKSIVTMLVAGSLLATLANAQAPTYTIRDLGPVGGAPGQPISIASNGLIGGAAGSSDGSMHAVLWFEGWKGDLGTSVLGGRNSAGFGISARGQLVGEAETANADPNGEDFCGFGASGLPTKGTTCAPFLWEFGLTTPLPTLGGGSGAANMINNRGQVAGVAENNKRDPACPAPQMLEFKPVLWEDGKVLELPTVNGDPDGIAFAINDNGQVAGASGDCGTFSPQLLVNLLPHHAVLWQDGKAIDLGNLGGTGHGFGIIALGINNPGQVVGSSDIAGDTSSHAFLWTKDSGMKDLGTLDGDASSSAISINDSGDTVGISLDSNFNPRAFLLHDGTLNDLNTLATADSPLFLLLACSINASGEIIGIGVDPSTGDAHGFEAIPVNSTDASGSSALASHSITRPKVLSEKTRRLLRNFGRFGVPAQR